MTKINREEYEILMGLIDSWKWIARDNDTALWVYEKEPSKYHEDSWDEFMDTCEIDSGLFQFIQWKDEEPYNIAELIEEYETEELRRSYFGPRFPKINGFYNANLATWVGLKESEETEVKKNIEWLNNEVEKRIKKIKTDEVSFAGSNYFDEGYIHGMRDVQAIANQLDEPEVLSQEDNINIVLDDLKEHIKEQQSLSQNVGMANTPAGNDTHYRQYDYVLECINEYEPSDDLQNLLMPKQELPAIPKFVAEWIEVSRKATYHLLGAVYYGAYNEDMKEWLFKGDKRTRQDNQDKLTRAWLDGFAVEEEQRYYALIKGHENISSDDKYWNYCITDESLDIGDNKVHTDVLAEYVLNATKDEWENLGINEDNADFVEVEELEE